MVDDDGTNAADAWSAHRTPRLRRQTRFFGKVTGATIFNILRMGDTEVDSEDRPVDDPPRVLSTEVLANPFDDIIPRDLPKPADAAAQAADAKSAKRKKKKRGKRDLTVLSFGDEAEGRARAATTYRPRVACLRSAPPGFD